VTIVESVGEECEGLRARIAELDTELSLALEAIVDLTEQLKAARAERGRWVARAKLLEARAAAARDALNGRPEALR